MRYWCSCLHRGKLERATFQRGIPVPDATRMPANVAYDSAVRGNFFNKVHRWRLRARRICTLSTWADHGHSGVSRLPEVPNCWEGWAAEVRFVVRDLRGVQARFDRTAELRYSKMDVFQLGGW